MTSGWERPGATVEEPSWEGSPGELRLEEQAPERADRPLRRWMFLILVALTGVVATLVAVVATDAFATTPSSAEAVSAFDEGFAAGSAQAQADLEEEIEARANATMVAQLDAAEERGFERGGAALVDLVDRSFANGFKLGWGEAVRQPEPSVPTADRFRVHESTAAGVLFIKQLELCPVLETSTLVPLFGVSSEDPSVICLAPSGP